MPWNGDLRLLIPTMGLVVAIIALVIVNYQQLIARYPQGGGAAAATGEAFGDRWAFLPIGAAIMATLAELELELGRERRASSRDAGVHGSSLRPSRRN